MIRFFLCIVIIFFSTYIGYQYTEKLKKKWMFYNDFYNFNIKFKENISYNQKTIKELLKNFNENNNFLIIANSIFNGQEINISFLTKEEIVFLEDYFSMIGKSDSQSQIEFLKSKEKEILDSLNKNKENYQKNKTIYIKIAFLIGVMISILII